jgi:glycine hydroxymethyltransferase
MSFISQEDPTVAGRIEKEHERQEATLNLIPFDPESTLIASGLRCGTPGISSRGMGVEEVKLIAV